MNLRFMIYKSCILALLLLNACAKQAPDDVEATPKKRILFFHGGGFVCRGPDVPGELSRLWCWAETSNDLTLPAVQAMGITSLDPQDMGVVSQLWSFRISWTGYCTVEFSGDPWVCSSNYASLTPGSYVDGYDCDVLGGGSFSCPNRNYTFTEAPQ